MKKANVHLIAATVVLYNPEISVLQNVKSYSRYVDLVIVIDNSDNVDENISLALKKQYKLMYIDNSENLGIAKALNSAAQIAYQQGYQWLLTMDQDSSFNRLQIEKFLQLPFSYVKDIKPVGIFTPYHATQTANKSNNCHNELITVKTCMTSGNLINLDIWLNVGGFDEKLFIDYVDHDYCLKIRKQGYVILQDNTTVLKHQLGEAERIKVANVSYTTSHHNYIRRYYMTRNRLYIIKRYFWFDPKFCRSEIYSLVAECFKILLREKQKLKKLKSISRGISDFFLGNYGRYQYMKDA